MVARVVSNSSPVIHLAKIDRLDLLADLFGELIIPQAVYDECITAGWRAVVLINAHTLWMIGSLGVILRAEECGAD